MDYIRIGPAFQPTQDTIYAMPARRVWIVSDQLLQFANTTITTAFTTIASSTTGMESAYQFMRSHATTNANVSVKSF
jgi:hypothetical protein